MVELEFLISKGYVASPSIDPGATMYSKDYSVINYHKSENRFTTNFSGQRIGFIEALKLNYISLVDYHEFVDEYLKLEKRRNVIEKILDNGKTNE